MSSAAMSPAEMSPAEMSPAAMSPAAMSPAAAEGSYIRGAGAGGADTDRVLAVLGGLLVVLLAVLSAYLFISASTRNANLSSLAAAGHPVTATVTGCTAISDGVGMGIETYDCYGTASYRGATFRGLIQGSRVDRAAGSRVPVLVLSGHSSGLTLATSVSARHRSSYWPGWATAGLTFVGVVVFLVLGRRRSRAGGAGGQPG